MENFPTKDNTKIHFAHSAYKLAERFDARNTGISCFQTWTVEDTIARMGEAHVLSLSGFWRNDFIEKPGLLRFIQVCAAGYDQFDKAGLAAADIRLANGTGVNKNAVSDHAMSLMLAFSRQLHIARDNQRKRHWRGMISDISKRENELSGRTVLIVGMGTIGARIAKLARAFEMKTIGVRRNFGEIKNVVDEAFAPSSLPDLWGQVDFVVLACPLTEETEKLVDANVFDAMRPDAYLINVARGGCVDEVALLEGLMDGKIAGAGIDVTKEEPLSEDSLLWQCDNVILTPHTGGETQQYEENVIDILLHNLDCLWQGERRLYNQIL